MESRQVQCAPGRGFLLLMTPTYLSWLPARLPCITIKQPPPSLVFREVLWCLAIQSPDRGKANPSGILSCLEWNSSNLKSVGMALIVNPSSSSSYPGQHLEKIRLASTWQHKKSMANTTQTKEGDAVEEQVRECA